MFDSCGFPQEESIETMFERLFSSTKSLEYMQQVQCAPFLLRRRSAISSDKVTYALGQLLQLMAALIADSIVGREDLAFALTLCDPLLGARVARHFAQVLCSRVCKRIINADFLRYLQLFSTMESLLCAQNHANMSRLLV